MHLTKPCAYCGNEYEAQSASRMERSKYCSMACRQRGRYANGEMPWVGKLRKPKGTVDRFNAKPCEGCYQQYTPTSGKQRWCLGCCPGKGDQQKASRYGITKPMFDAMYFDQDGRCPLCCSREATVIDHCHATGAVRGLLCSKCNLGLHFIEDPDFVGKAGEYLADA